MINYNSETIGEFQESEFGKWFTYSKAEENVFGLPFQIDVLDGKRYATILKTVVYVCIDEDDFGQPVMEKWNLVKHYIRKSSFKNR